MKSLVLEHVFFATAAALACIFTFLKCELCTQLELMNCVIVSSAVCYENGTNLLLFVWSKPFLSECAIGSSHRKCWLAAQRATPVRGPLLPVMLLNWRCSGTEQYCLGSFLLCTKCHLKSFPTIPLPCGKAMGAVVANPYCHQAFLKKFPCDLRRTCLPLITGLFCFKTEFSQIEEWGVRRLIG